MSESDWLSGGWHKRYISKSQIKKMKREMKEATDKRENVTKIKEDKKKLQEEIEAEKLLIQFDEEIAK